MLGLSLRPGCRGYADTPKTEARIRLRNRWYPSASIPSDSSVGGEEGSETTGKDLLSGSSHGTPCLVHRHFALRVAKNKAVDALRRAETKARGPSLGRATGRSWQRWIRGTCATEHVVDERSGDPPGRVRDVQERLGRRQRDLPRARVPILQLHRVRVRTHRRGRQRRPRLHGRLRTLRGVPRCRPGRAECPPCYACVPPGERRVEDRSPTWRRPC